MSKNRTYYRVEKWLSHYGDDGTSYEECYRQRTFSSLEEAQEYYDNASSVYKVKLYEVDDFLLGEREPFEELWEKEVKARLRKTLESIGDKFTDEEWEEFVNKVEEQCGPQNT